MNRLSTGAIVGIGMGVSVAGAGLVTITVYFLVRRRLFKKQQKRWQEQMRAMGGDEKSPEPGMGMGMGMPGPMVAVTTDGKRGPAMVMLQPSSNEKAYELPLNFMMTTTTDNTMRSSVNTMGSLGAGEYYSREKETSSVMSSRFSTDSDTAPIVKMGSKSSKREDKTATWLRRNSIYEMP